mgnify:CR=1 FL=1
MERGLLYAELMKLSTALRQLESNPNKDNDNLTRASALALGTIFTETWVPNRPSMSTELSVVTVGSGLELPRRMVSFRQDLHHRKGYTPHRCQ